MFNILKSDKNEYMSVINVDLRYLCHDEEEWNEFVSALKKKYKYVESDTYGIISYYYKNDFLSEKQIKALVSTEYYDFNNRNHDNTWDVSEDSKILKLCEKPYTTTYLFMAVRLAIMQSHEKATEYLMCNMMNYYIWPDDVDTNFIYFDFEINKNLDVRGISFSDLYKVNIIDYIRKSINDDIYINIHLDEFYIPCKEFYEKKHFVHENLVYGYNDKSEEIFAYGIDNNHRYSQIKIKYDDFYEAFERGKYYAFCGAKYLIDKYPWPVTLLELKIEESKEKIDFNRFKGNLSDYVLGRGRKIEGRNLLWGNKANSFIINELKTGNKKNIIDFKTFQLLSEQKNVVFDACHFLVKKQKVTEKELCRLSLFLEKYKNVKKDFFLIKVEYMRMLTNEGKFNNMDYIICDSKNQKKILNMLECAVKKEDGIIKGFLEEMY